MEAPEHIERELMSPDLKPAVGISVLTALKREMVISVI